jgi:hypothetical protein
MIEHYATDDGSTSTDTWEKTKKELLDSLKVEMIDMTLVEFRIIISIFDAINKNITFLRHFSKNGMH